MPRMKLTARIVESMKPSGKRVQVFDTDQRGLCLRISESGEKSFSVCYKHCGRMKRLTLGKFPEVGLADARSRAREALNKVANGVDPQQQKQIERLADTFGELVNTFLEKYADKKRSGREDRRILNKYLVPQLRHVRAKDVMRAQIRVVLDEIAKDAPIMANRVLASVRKMYNWAIGQDLVEHNPCFKLPAPSKERRRDRVLSNDELKRVWHALENDKSSTIADAFEMRLLTAQRGGEVLSMRWADIDLKTRWWTIPMERSKNKMPHRVWLSTPAMNILKRRKEADGESPWVFPGRRKGQPMVETKRVLESIRTASGIEEWRGHDLRRTAASNMAAMGIPRFIVGRVLNHAESGVTAVYDRHSYDAEKKDALDKWAAKLMRIVSELRTESGWEVGVKPAVTG
jgi:integrase